MTVRLSGDEKGVYVVAATPFDETGRIDERSIETMVAFYREKGADGLTILGMMGEAQKLTQAEAIAVTRMILRAADGMKVIVGVSSPSLAAMGELGREVMALGAAGVMVAPGAAVRTDDQAVGYYGEAVAALGSDIPVVVQDFPLATNIVLSMPALGRIVEQNPSVVMLKHEDWPGLAKITGLRRTEAEGRRRISILCGNAGMFLPEEMLRGADGAMTGFCFPEMMAQVYRLCTAGDAERARDLFDAYLPLMRYEMQPGIGLAVRKYVLAKRGAIASATQRRPGALLAPAAVAEVEALWRRQERRLAELG